MTKLYKNLSMMVVLLSVVSFAKAANTAKDNVKKAFGTVVMTCLGACVRPTLQTVIVAGLSDYTLRNSLPALKKVAGQAFKPVAEKTIPAALVYGPVMAAFKIAHNAKQSK
jgi:hypothetical protein